MMTFDDFDAWGDTVSGASLRLACDGVEHRAWTLGIVDLGTVVVQVASEGGGNICYGANTHGGPTLFVPLTRASEHVANGERLDDASLFVIPSGADFRIRLRKRAHAWCSIALPGDVAVPALPPTKWPPENCSRRRRHAYLLGWSNESSWDGPGSIATISFAARWSRSKTRQSCPRRPISPVASA
jgi:hypothetical protein